MRPIFGVNRNDRKNLNDNSDIFITRRASDELLTEYETISDQVFREVEHEYDDEFRRNRRKRMTMLLTVGAIVAAVNLILTIAFGQFNELLAEKPALIIVSIGYIAVFAVYMLCTRVLRKKSADVKEASEADASAGESNISSCEDEPDPRIVAIENKIYASLGVTDAARTVDILCFDYKTVNGEPVPKKGLKTVDFVNRGMKIFRDGDSLCLVDEECRYEFPLAGLRTVKTVRGEFLLLLWTKSISCDEGEYRPYGMRKNSLDCVLFDTYHILELEKDGEVYGLYFPCYELPVIKEIVDVSVE